MSIIVSKSKENEANQSTRAQNICSFRSSDEALMVQEASEMGLQSHWYRLTNNDE